MKSGQLFWGFLLLCVGALFLLVRYDVIINDFGFVWDLWPLVFILWGAMIIFKKGIARSVLSSVFGLFFATVFNVPAEYGTFHSKCKSSVPLNFFSPRDFPFKNNSTVSQLL